MNVEYYKNLKKEDINSLESMVLIINAKILELRSSTDVKIKNKISLERKKLKTVMYRISKLKNE